MYLLVYAPTENKQAVSNQSARVALSYLRHVLKVYLASFKRLTINFVNSFLGDTGMVTTINEKLAFMYNCSVTPSLAGIPAPSLPRHPF